MLSQLGAHEVFSSTAALSDAGGVDIILAAGNAFEPVMEAMAALRPDGRVVLMGVGGRAITVPTSIMWVRGRALGSSQNHPEHLYEALYYVARGKVKVITEVYPLDQIATAYDQVAEGKVRFRAVIKP